MLNTDALIRDAGIIVNIIFILTERQRDREREIPCLLSLAKSSQQPGLSQAEVRSLVLNLIPYLAYCK